MFNLYLSAESVTRIDAFVEEMARAQREDQRATALDIAARFLSGEVCPLAGAHPSGQRTIRTNKVAPRLKHRSADVARIMSRDCGVYAWALRKCRDLRAAGMDPDEARRSELTQVLAEATARMDDVERLAYLKRYRELQRVAARYARARLEAVGGPAPSASVAETAAAPVADASAGESPVPSDAPRTAAPLPGREALRENVLAPEAPLRDQIALLTEEILADTSFEAMVYGNVAQLVSRMARTNISDQGLLSEIAERDLDAEERLRYAVAIYAERVIEKGDTFLPPEDVALAVNSLADQGKLAAELMVEVRQNAAQGDFALSPETEETVAAIAFALGVAVSLGLMLVAVGALFGSPLMAVGSVAGLDEWFHIVGAVIWGALQVGAAAPFLLEAAEWLEDDVEEGAKRVITSLAVGAKRLLAVGVDAVSGVVQGVRSKMAQPAAIDA